MANYSSFDLPPLPDYTLHPVPHLFPPIPDNILALILPVLAYWAVSMIFHVIDVNDLFPQYRLHTPAEILKRNHVTRWEVVRDVVLQHIIQTTAGLVLAYFDSVEYYGKEEYDIAVWARRIRLLQRAVPPALSVLGINAVGLANKLSSYPALVGIISGGQYPLVTKAIVTDAGQRLIAPAFCQWELSLARLIFWYLVPALQFFCGVVFVDSWQYFLHRAMHLNRWLYSELSRSGIFVRGGANMFFLHSATLHARHHRLYVPYAFGALYNHPIEGFVLDTAGTGLAFLLTGMTNRQGMWFFTCSTIKTVDDHCGYAFPFDPLQHLTSNNAAYHDIHHQSWGIKTNFSQPFFTFWDGLLNTRWTGGDVTLRYERSRQNAQRLVNEDKAKSEAETGAGNVDVPVSSQKDETESPGCGISLSSVRRKTTSCSNQSEGRSSMSHRLRGSIRQK